MAASKVLKCPRSVRSRCTPPRLFLDDQFDVVNPETGSVSSHRKKMILDEPVTKKNTAPVKISPWTLAARMNADEVSKAAAEARKKSKILQPVTRQEARYSLETESSYSISGRRMGGGPKLDNNKKRSSKRIRLPAELSHEPLPTISREGAEISMRHLMTDGFRTYVPPLQLETRGSFLPKGISTEYGCKSFIFSGEQFRLALGPSFWGFRHRGNQTTCWALYR